MASINVQNSRHIYDFDKAEKKYTTPKQQESHSRFTVCPMCHNVKYKKQWYATDSKVGLLSKGNSVHTSLRRCPACQMKMEGFCSAIVTIHDVPKVLRSKIEAYIEREGTFISSKNPQNRVLNILETLDGFEVQLATNRAARTLIKKLQEVLFNVGEVITRTKVGPYRVQNTDMYLHIKHFL